MNAIFTYIKHVREEFQHIVWPTNRTATGHTLIVLLIVALMAVFVAVLDYILGGFVATIIGG